MFLWARAKTTNSAGKTCSRQKSRSRTRWSARQRGWDRIRLLSSHDTSFNRDFGMEGADGSQNPGLSVFTRTPDGAVYHRYTIGAEFDERNNRGIDPYSPVWNLFDLLPQGRGEWYPTHDYMLRYLS